MKTRGEVLDESAKQSSSWKGGGSTKELPSWDETNDETIGTTLSGRRQRRTHILAKGEYCVCRRETIQVGRV